MNAYKENKLVRDILAILYKQKGCKVYYWLKQIRKLLHYIKSRYLIINGLIYCHVTNLIYTIAHYSMLFPTVGWPTTSALAANLAYLYTLPLYTFFSSLYYNVVIQSTSLQYCDSLWYL